MTVLMTEATLEDPWAVGALMKGDKTVGDAEAEGLQRRLAAAAAAAAPPNIEIKIEKGGKEYRISPLAERRQKESDVGMPSAASATKRAHQRDKERDKSSSEEEVDAATAIEELLRQQGGALKATGAHLMDMESMAQLSLKIVRRSKDLSVKRWHEEIDAIDIKVHTDFPNEILATTKVEHDLLIWSKGDKQRQKLFEGLKKMVAKVEGAMVILGRPAFKNSIQKPCNIIYAAIKKAVMTRPAIRTILPSATKQNWALVSGDDIIASGTVGEHGGGIEILVADQFLVGNAKIAGGSIAALIEQEISKGHTHYPYTASLSTTPNSSLKGFSPSKGGKSGKGAGSGPRSPFDVKERNASGSDGKGRR